MKKILNMVLVFLFVFVLSSCDLPITNNNNDSNNPVLTLTGGTSSVEIGEDYTAPICVATDEEDGELTCTLSGTVDVNTLGEYVLTYTVTDSDGNKSNVALSPNLIRVLEASNTGDLMPLPVIKAITENSVITDEVLDIFTTSIKTEFDRIRRESAIKEDVTRRQIVGFNTEEFDTEKGELKEQRAYTLHNTSLLLNPVTKKDLEDIANRNNASFDEALVELEITPEQFKISLKDILDDQFDEFRNEINDLNIESLFFSL